MKAYCPLFWLTVRTLSTFSVESYAENYDMLAYLERTNVYMFLQQEVTLPPVNDFTKAMISCEREQQLREDILNQGNMLYLWNCYYKDADLELGAFFEWEELQAELELDSIEVTDFIAPEMFWEDGTDQAAVKSIAFLWKRRSIMTDGIITASVILHSCLRGLVLIVWERCPLRR